MRALVRAQPGDVAAVEPDRAADEAGHAHDRVDQRGLAHAIAAEQRKRLALAQGERDLVEDDRFAIARGQPLDLQHVRH